MDRSFPNKSITCDNHGQRQREKQSKFINRVKREQKSLRTKLVISFNQHLLQIVRCITVRSLLFTVQ